MAGLTLDSNWLRVLIIWLYYGWFTTLHFTWNSLYKYLWKKLNKGYDNKAWLHFTQYKSRQTSASPHLNVEESEKYTSTRERDKEAEKQEYSKLLCGVVTHWYWGMSQHALLLYHTFHMAEAVLLNDLTSEWFNRFLAYKWMQWKKIMNRYLVCNLHTSFVLFIQSNCTLQAKHKTY